VGNIAGEAYALTILCPVRLSRLERLKGVLAGFPLGEDSPLARTGTTHFARWVVIDDLVYEGTGPRDTLGSPYLLFTSNLDGDGESYLRHLAQVCERQVHEVWSNCVGYPGGGDVPALVGYLLRHKVDAATFFSAYPTASVQRVRQVLALRQKLIQFAIDAQHMDDARLLSTFRGLFEIVGP
jgi:hypothetical protein